MKTTQTTILYNKYKELILLNKNIIVAGICAFFSAAFLTQFYFTQYNESHIANSIVALISEYSAYFPIFGLLFYRDNRHRYINPLTGKKDFKLIKTDIKKLLTALSISELAYSLSKNIRHLSISTTWNNAISGVYARLISSINSIDPIDQLLDNTSSNAVQNPRGTTADSVARIPSVFTFYSMQLQQLQLALLSCIINLQPEAYQQENPYLI